MRQSLMSLMRSYAAPISALANRLPRRTGAPLARVFGALLSLALACAVVLGGCAFLSGAHQTSGASAFATPTPAFVSHGPLAQVVAPAIWGTGVQSVDTTYDQAHGLATVTITLGGTVPNTDAKVSAAQALAKGLCFMAEQALWTSATNLTEVKVVVQGPVQDEYGSLVNGAYAVAVVEAANGRAIAWATSNSDSAWRSYDSVFLRDSYVVAD